VEFGPITVAKQDDCRQLIIMLNQRESVANGCGCSRDCSRMAPNGRLAELRIERGIASREALLCVAIRRRLLVILGLSKDESAEEQARGGATGGNEEDYWLLKPVEMRRAGRLTPCEVFCFGSSRKSTAHEPRGNRNNLY
jgi:hypothetical protein